MAIKEIGKRIARWAVPIDTKAPSNTKLEDLVDKVVSENEVVRSIISKNPERDSEIRRQLGYIIQDCYNENKNLRRLSQYIDTMDKTLVPVDVLADYLKLFFGVGGYSLSAGKEMIEMGPKLAYVAYYTSKTKDFVGSLGNLLYEGLSWFIPGSLLDLTNRYVKQAEKYVLKNATAKFLKHPSKIEKQEYQNAA
jgi:hypothetical protein